MLRFFRIEFIIKNIALHKALKTRVFKKKKKNEEEEKHIITKPITFSLSLKSNIFCY